MFRLLRRTWKYTVALLTGGSRTPPIPRSRSSRRSRRASGSTGCSLQQAAAVIGNQHELELRLGRSIDRSKGCVPLRATPCAMRVGRRGRRAKTRPIRGDGAVVRCRARATREAEMRDLKVLHDRAVVGAAAARESVETERPGAAAAAAERTPIVPARSDEAAGADERPPRLDQRVGARRRRAVVRAGPREARPPVLAGARGGRGLARPRSRFVRSACRRRASTPRRRCNSLGCVRVSSMQMGPK